MNDRPNPFRPGDGAEPPYLAGRERELDAFDDVLRSTRDGNMKNVLLYGPRGVGKTVLLGRLASMCRGRGFLPVRWRMGGPRDADPDKFANSLERAVRGAMGPPGAEGGGRSPGPPAAGAPRPPHGGGAGVPMADRLADYLVKSWGAMAERGYEGAALLLDDFPAAGGAGGGRYTLGDFIAAVNEAQMRGCRYSAALSGLPALAKSVARGPSYAGRMFKPVRVACLAGPDARDALVRPLDGTGRRISPALARAVAGDTKGHPYSVQYFAREILRRTDRDGVGMRDYGPAREGILRSLYDGLFGRRAAGLAPGERETLRRMAAIPGDRLRPAHIAEAAGASRGAISSRLRRLEEKGAVCRNDLGLYELALPLLRQYLEAGSPAPAPCSGRAGGRGPQG